MNRIKITTDKPKREKSKYIRVTSVLGFLDSAWKEYWYKNLAKKVPNPMEEADRIGKESGEFGTAVHEIVETYLLKKTLDKVYTDRQVQCANTLIQWLAEARAEVLMVQGKPAIEFEVVSESLGLIGHLDAVLTIGGTPWLIDWKTSSKMRKTFPLQKAAYAKMLQIQYGINVNDGATLRVDRDPSADKQFEISEYHGLLDTYWDVYKAGLDFYSFMNNKGKWAIKKVKGVK